MISNETLCDEKGYEYKALETDHGTTLTVDQCDLWRDKAIRAAYVRALELTGTFDWAIPRVGSSDLFYWRRCGISPRTSESTRSG